MALLVGGLVLLGGGCAPNWNPRGQHERITCRVTVGAACDPDDFKQPVTIRLYATYQPTGKDLSGSTGYSDQFGGFIGETIANLPPPDKELEKLSKRHCGGTTNHGFLFEIPDWLKDGRKRWVYAYAMNIGRGKNIRLQKTPKEHMCVVPKSSCVSIEAPDQVGPSQDFTARVTMKNLGPTITLPYPLKGPGPTSTFTPLWTRPAGYSLRTETPQNNTQWGLSRLDIPAGMRVLKDQSHTFTINARAPVAPGSYQFDWSMYKEDTGGTNTLAILDPTAPGFFGEVCRKTIQVGSGTPPPPPSPPPSPPPPAPLTPGLILPRFQEQP